MASSAISEGSSSSSEKSSWFYLFGGTRYAVLLLCTACLSLVVADSLALNFTVICMDSTLANGTRMPMFTLPEQGWLFSAVAIGQLLGTLPITWITNRIGPRKMFTLYGGICALATLAIPPSVELGGFVGIFVMRIVQGVGVACAWVFLGAVSAQWVPPCSSAIFIAFLSCNLQFGPIISMPLAAEFCSSNYLTWRHVFYLLGLISLLFFAIFYGFFRNSPQQQKHVSQKELALFEQHKLSSTSSTTTSSFNGGNNNGTTTPHHNTAKVPYRAILCDHVFWGVFLSMCSGNMAFQIFWQYGPVYLNKALGLKVADTGMASALPFLLSAIAKIVAGELSDHVHWISEKAKVILFASASQYLMAGCFMALAILPKCGIVNVGVMQACFTAATLFSGLNVVGVVKCTQLISRQFSPVLFSWNTLTMSIIMLLLPLIVSWLTPTNSIDEWGNVYFFITAIVCAGTTLFNFTAEVEPRAWTVVEEENGKQSSSKCSVQSAASSHHAITTEKQQPQRMKNVIFTIETGGGGGIDEENSIGKTMKNNNGKGVMGF